MPCHVTLPNRLKIVASVVGRKIPQRASAPVREKIDWINFGRVTKGSIGSKNTSR